MSDRASASPESACAPADLTPQSPRPESHSPGASPEAATSPVVTDAKRSKPKGGFGFSISSILSKPDKRAPSAASTSPTGLPHLPGLAAAEAASKSPLSFFFPQLGPHHFDGKMAPWYPQWFPGPPASHYLGRGNEGKILLIFRKLRATGKPEMLGFYQKR